MHYIYNIQYSYITSLRVLQDITAKREKTEYYVMSCSTPVTSSPAHTHLLHICTIVILINS